MPNASPTHERRFWVKVQCGGNDDCWPWLAAVDTHGYGRFKLGTNRKAHRVSYEMAVGPIPPGMTIDHLCERKDCVNPAHLEPVPEHVNRTRWMTAERVEEARRLSRDLNARLTPREHALRSGACRLTDEQVREIRRRRATGETCRSVAADMPANHTQVSKIARRETYSWVV